MPGRREVPAMRRKPFVEVCGDTLSLLNSKLGRFSQ
jgi:hypothetical protein